MLDLVCPLPSPPSSLRLITCEGWVDHISADPSRETDLVLVPSDKLQTAKTALGQAGWTFDD